MTRNLLAVLAVSLAVSCGGVEPVDPTPPTPVTPVDPTPAKDTNAPTITVSTSTVNVIAGPAVTISGNQLKIGDQSVATWKDDKSTSCTVALSFTPTSGSLKPLNSWDKVSEAGKLQIKATDEAGNSATAEITLTREDSQAPQIAVTIHDKNVIAGVTIIVQDNQLMFNEEVAASWTDDFTTVCTTELSLVPAGASEAKAIASGDHLSEAGALKLAVADEFNNKATAEINLTAIAVYGLDNLQNKQLQVDQEANLLEGVTFAEGLTLQKVEIEADGVRTDVSAPEAYTPEYPGSVNLILTIVKPDGSTLVERADGLVVNPLDYQAPQLEVVNIFETTFSWYKKLNQETKNYVKPLLEVAYYASNRCRDSYTDNIILWETYDEIPNIWTTSQNDDHAERWGFHIHLLCPGIDIKWCIDNTQWDRQCLEKYIDDHPNVSFIISCAADTAVWSNRDRWNESENVKALRRVLQKPNVTTVIAGDNKSPSSSKRKLYNEIIKTWDNFKWSSVNGALNNSFLAVWQYSSSEKNFFSSKSNEWLKWRMTVWFDGEEHTAVIHTNSLVYEDYTTYRESDCSMAAATIAAHLRNITDVIRHNHPMTMAAATQKIKQNYLKTERFKYKDPDTDQLVEWEHWHEFDGQKITNHEVLPLNELESILLTSACGEILLPGRKGLYYEGMGIYFKYEGKTYESVKANQAVLEQALKSGSVEWYFNGNQFRKEGGKGTLTLTVGSTDTDAKVFLQTTVTKPVLSE